MVKEKLYPFHIGILIYMTQTGVLVLSLPRMLAETFGYNGWLALPILAAVASLNIGLIAIVHRMGKGKSIFSILESALHKAVLFPLYAALSAVWALTGCMTAKNYVYIFQMLSFNTTHPMLFKALLDILIYLLMIKGIYNISKASTSFFWMIQWMLLLLIFFVKDFSWVRMTPFFFKGGTDVLKGGMSVFTAFLGYELSILLFPYSDSNKKVMRAVFAGHLFTTFNYIVLSFICFGFFSFEQLKKLMYPVIDLLSYIQLPFIERVENLLFAFFLFSTVATVVMYLWAAQESMRQMMPGVPQKLLAFIIVTASFIVSWVPDTLVEVGKWLEYLGNASSGIAFALPMLLILILLIKKGAKL
ncbi:spore germination protein [Paenibacillus sp. N4]|uniref:GerAB/ArcD/ProY family transporter n=1 Tax=Paenibacillus vietnamensis TaxID=2590547 RepID=UPI001CD120B0|nr:GerAB/ArcD/ProY family transporter [Paenibacillus vietnamensis]MCA0755534.1 spore germination protein [Paenibacillus vietnamensis]